MQNKHQIFFFSFGRPNFGGGGGSTWLGQIPKFFQKFDLKAPLRVTCTEAGVLIALGPESGAATVRLNWNLEQFCHYVQV